MKCYRDEIFTLTFFSMSVKCGYRKPSGWRFLSIFKKNEAVIEGRNLQISSAIKMDELIGDWVSDVSDPPSSTPSVSWSETLITRDLTERATILVKSPWDTKLEPLTQLPVSIVLWWCSSSYFYSEKFLSCQIFLSKNNSMNIIIKQYLRPS